jgi:hypothetical protein
VVCWFHQVVVYLEVEPVEPLLTQATPDDGHTHSSHDPEALSAHGPRLCRQ